MTSAIDDSTRRFNCSTGVRVSLNVPTLRRFGVVFVLVAVAVRGLGSTVLVALSSTAAKLTCRVFGNSCLSAVMAEEVGMVSASVFGIV